MRPVEVAEFEAHVVESNHNLQLLMALRNLWIAQSSGEVRQDARMRLDLFYEVERLTSRCVLLSFSFIYKFVLKRRLMYKQLASLSIVLQVLAWSSVARVNDALTSAKVVLAALYKARI